MATKTTTKTKAASRSGSSGSGGRRKTAKQKEAERIARRQRWAVVLFALGIFLAAVTYIEGASLWKGLHLCLFGLCGFGAYLAAPVVLYSAVLLSMERQTPSPIALAWQSGGLLLLISGALQIFGEGLPDAGGFLGNFFALFDGGVALTGGGLLGGLIGLPLLSLFGKTGAVVVILLLIFVFIMLLTGTTLVGLFRTAAVPVQKLGEVATASAENYRTTLEEKKEQREQRRQRFNIDIPLDEAPVRQEEPVAVSGEAVPPGDKPQPAAPAAGEPPVKASVPEPVKAESAPNDKNAYIDDIIRRMVQNQQEPKAPAAPAAAQVVPEPLPDSPPETPADPEETEGVGEGQEVLEKPQEESRPYIFPSIGLLNEPKDSGGEDSPDELRANAQRLVDTLQSFGVQTRIIDICRGPAVTRYELQPSAGVKISKITGLADDIALNLAASGVRIEAPIPNKAAVGIEIPNRTIQAVTLREVLDTPEFTGAKSKLTVAMGRDIAGNITLADIAKMPHVLIAGATGSGKSVCINTIIMSLLYKASDDEVKFLMIDPKVVELGIYNGIPHLLVPVVTDPKKAAGALNWAVQEMLKRYQTFAENSVRDLSSYNELAETSETLPKLPQIVIIIDELSDLMMAAPSDVEDAICRLAQMARAAGMHLVIATQRPSVDVITGIIKANIPSRIAFAVSSQVDSRTILDGSGAEKLLGRGDMLFAPVGSPKPLRVQGCFVTDKEVERVVSFIKEGEKHQYDQQIMEEIDRATPAEKGSGSGDGGGFEDSDDLLMDAIECVVDSGQASTSFLQRRLKVGYARAGRLMDEMEQMGIVGPFEGSKPRQLLISRDRWYEMKLGSQQPAQSPDGAGSQ